MRQLMILALLVGGCGGDGGKALQDGPGVAQEAAEWPTAAWVAADLDAAAWAQERCAEAGLDVWVRSTGERRWAVTGRAGDLVAIRRALEHDAGGVDRWGYVAARP